MKKIVIGILIALLLFVAFTIYLNIFFWGTFRFIGSINVKEAPNLKVAFYQENEFDSSTGVYVEILKDTTVLHHKCMLLGSGDYMHLNNFWVGFIDSVIYISAFKETDVYELYDLKNNTTLIGCTERYNADTNYVDSLRQMTISNLSALDSNFVDMRK